MGGRGSAYYADNADTENKFRMDFHFITDEDDFDPESERSEYELFEKLKSKNFSMRRSTDKHELYNLEDHQQIIYDLTKKYEKQLDVKNQKYEFEFRSAKTNAYGYQYDAYDQQMQVSTRLVLKNGVIRAPEAYRSKMKNHIERGEFAPVDDKNLHISTTVHEYGHVVESAIMHKYFREHNIPITKHTVNKYKENLATKIKNKVIDICKTKYKDDKIYVSEYAEANDNPFEFFAETFTNMELSSKPKPIALALRDYLNGDRLL